MSKKSTKSEITKIEKKLKQIVDGKWHELPAAVEKLKARLEELKCQQ